MESPRQQELDDVTLRRAQRGDVGACRALVECYEVRVFALIGRMLGHRGQPADREDLAQETFLHVFKALGNFSQLGTAKLSSWILTFAARRAIDHLRKTGRVLESPLSEEVIAPERADESARQSILLSAVEQAVSGLSPEYRAAFLLREYHDLSYDEIARSLRIEVGTVRSRLSRARAEVRAAALEVRNDQ